MTVNQFFRVLTFFLGVLIFSALLAIGVWSVKQYGMVLDILSEPYSHRPAARNPLLRCLEFRFRTEESSQEAYRSYCHGQLS